MTNKTKFLYAVIIALVLMNIGTLAFVFLNKGGKPNNPRQVSVWLTQQLQLNEQQQAQDETLQEEHRANMEAIHTQDRHLHDTYFKLLQGEATDSVTVKILADSIAANRLQTELTTFYDFKKIRAICNAEQQKKFDEIIGEALRMMGPRPPRR